MSFQIMIMIVANATVFGTAGFAAIFAPYGLAAWADIRCPTCGQPCTVTSPLARWNGAQPHQHRDRTPMCPSTTNAAVKALPVDVRRDCDLVPA